MNPSHVQTFENALEFVLALATFEDFLQLLNQVLIGRLSWRLLGCVFQIQSV